MTIALTTPIAVPNVSKVHVTQCDTDDVNQVAVVRVNVMGAGGRVYGEYIVYVANGDAGNPPDLSKASTGLGINGASQSYSDAFQPVKSINIVGGYDRVAAIMDGAGNRAAKMRALETLGLADGWLAAGLAGAVS